MRTTAACFLALLLPAFSLAEEKLPTPPPDWKLEVLLSSPKLKHPSVVCSAPDGRIFVAEDPMDIATPRADMTEGRILCIQPDGRLTVFADKLYAVFGLQYLDGKLYVLHNPKFSVFTDDPDRGVAKDRVDLIESTNPNPWALDWNDHVPANFRLAMDGYFYVAVGDKGLYNCVGRDGKRIDMKGGGILRLRLDGTGLEIYSTGVRNILDVAMTDEDEIFTYDNTDEQQWMGRLTHMIDGGFYGYPYDFVPRRPYTLWMLADYGPGAATGALAYTEDALPSEYQNNLFLADFGKRNLLRVKLERDGATFIATEKQDLFTNVPDDFRPVGIALSHDGASIYICDWQHRDTKENVAVGRLLKLAYTGKTGAKRKPDWYIPAATNRPFTATNDDLLAALSHPSRNVRMIAQRRLAERLRERGGTGVPPVKQLTDLLHSPATSNQSKYHLLWLLRAINDNDARAALLKSASAPTSPPVRRQALRTLATPAKAALPQSPTTPLHEALSDPDASIRFHAATTLGRHAEPASIPHLLKALSQQDLFARYAAFTALNRIGRANPSAWPAIAKGLEFDDRRTREATTYAFRETYDLPLVNHLVTLVRDQTKPPHARFLALSLLADIHRKPPEWKGEWWAYHPVNSPPPRKTVDWHGTDPILATIRAALHDRSKDVALHAIDAVRVTRDAASAPVLRRIMKEPADLQTAHLLIRTLGELRDEASIETFVHTLEMDPEELDPFTIALVLEAAEKIAHPKFIPALARHVKLPHETHAKLALSALAAIDKTNEAATAAMLAAPSHRNVAVRRHAIRALGDRRARSAIPDLLATVNDPEVRADALAALTKLPDPRALDAYLFALSGKDAALREQARSAISAIAPHAVPMIEARLHTLSPNTVAELQRALVDFPPAKDSPLFSEKITRPSPADYEAFALKTNGDPARGKSLFTDESGLACIRCHTNTHARPRADEAQAFMPGSPTNTTNAIGPDLTTIGTQFPRAALIESILYPNKSVREGFAEFIVTTRSRDQFSGLFRGEDTDSITLLDASGLLQRIPKDRITQRRTSDRSIMPEELHTPLSLQEFADLIAFLESCKTTPDEGTASVHGAAVGPPPGFTALFNGKDLTGWKADDETKKHWTVKEGILHHDGIDKDLRTQADFTDFELRLDFRFPGPTKWEDFPLIASDGNEATDAAGRVVTRRVLDAGDSGVFLRGHRKAQANLFCYPIGSGEVWEYRTDPAMPPAVRRAVTPKTQADNPPGEWNRMTITMQGDRLTVTVNGTEVITDAPLPGIPQAGSIGLQHEHGPVDFRNIAIRPL